MPIPQITPITKHRNSPNNPNKSLPTTSPLAPGIYVVAHGHALPFPGPIKDRERGTFVQPT